MKIQARDLKIGQDVKFGNEWMIVEELIYGTQKNGVPYVNVCGTVYAGRIRSRYYGNRPIHSYYATHNCPKLQTWVTVR